MTTDVHPVGSAENPVFRRAARVVLLDAAGRVLLLHGRDPGRPDFRYWFTPGGGLDPGETPAVGAARELREEIGVVIEPARLGEPVHQETIEFPFEGTWYRQEQEYFVAVVEAAGISTDGLDEVERTAIAGFRWWWPAELRETDERYYPGDLLALLDRLGVG